MKFFKSPEFIGVITALLITAAVVCPFYFIVQKTQKRIDSRQGQIILYSSDGKEIQRWNGRKVSMGSRNSTCYFTNVENGKEMNVTGNFVVEFSN